MHEPQDSCTVLECSVLLAMWTLCAVSLTLSTCNSALPGPLFSSQLCLWSPGCGDQRAEVAFLTFPGRGTSWLGSEPKQLFLYCNLWGIFMNYSMWLHKRCRCWGSIRSSMIHLLSTNCVPSILLSTGVAMATKIEIVSAFIVYYFWTNQTHEEAIVMWFHKDSDKAITEHSEST